MSVPARFGSRGSQVNAWLSLKTKGQMRDPSWASVACVAMLPRRCACTWQSRLPTGRSPVAIVLHMSTGKRPPPQSIGGIWDAWASLTPATSFRDAGMTLGAMPGKRKALATCFDQGPVEAMPNLQLGRGT